MITFSIMTEKGKKKKFLFAGLGLAIFFLISAGLAYGTNLNDTITKVFKRIYPAAILAHGYISIADLDQARQIARKLDPATDPNKVFEELIKSREKMQLARNLHLNFDSGNFSDEIKFYTTGRKQKYDQFLNDYFSGDERLFQNYVLNPQVYDSLLKIKYNSNFAANNDAYNKAENVLAKLDSGQKFEDLAKTYSDDKVSGQLGGDLGFVNAGQLLPELEKAVMSAKVGEIKKEIVISRLGYHIIYPVETAQQNGQKVWHVKHVLIQTQGYDSWLTTQLSKFAVWRIL